MSSDTLGDTELSRRRLLAGAGATGMLAGVSGLIPGGIDTAWAAGAADSILSVKDYGALGDGVTDDSAAIQAAIIDAADDGRTVYLPPGVYMLGNRLRMRDGLTMRGAGRFLTTLRLLPSWDGPILDTEVKGQFDDDLTLSGLTFDGDGENSESTTEGTAALLHTYNLHRWHVVDCRFMRGRGYGVGMLGNLTKGNGPQEDIYFANCEFISNGKLSLSDGIDTKSGHRVTLVNCLAANEGIGFDIRAHFATLVNCHALNCSFGIVLRSSQNLPGSTDEDSLITVLGGSAENCGGGLSVSHTTDQSIEEGYTYVTVAGFSARKNINGLGTSGPTPPNSDNAITLSILGGEFAENDGFGIGVNGTRELTVQGAICRENNSDGIRLTNTPNATIAGCQLRDNGGWGINANEDILGASDGLAAVGNAFDGNAEGNLFNGGRNSKAAANASDQSATVASAANMALPQCHDAIVVTGKTNISSIAASRNGRTVILGFAQALTVANGGNLKLRADFNATFADTLTLVCHDGVWYELSRSAN
jgi:hypothetical protein